jgi:hypothetical protein
MLPPEIISLIASFSTPYVSLVLGREPDPIQLFAGGGPGILLTQIIERDADFRLLNHMKVYYPDANVPIYKGVITQDEKVIRSICSVWGTRVSHLGRKRAMETQFAFGIRYIFESDNVIDLNTHYVYIGRMDMVDTTVDDPLGCVWDVQSLSRCYADENLRKYLSTDQIVKYLGKTNQMDPDDKWYREMLYYANHTSDADDDIGTDYCDAENALYITKYCVDKIQWVESIGLHVRIPGVLDRYVGEHNTDDTAIALLTYYKSAINPSYGKPVVW